MKRLIIAGLILASLIAPGQITAMITPNPCQFFPVTKPIGQTDLNGRIQDCLRWKKSQDVISRGPHGLLPDVAYFSVASIVRLADPINLGASLILVTLVWGLSRKWKA